MILRFIGFSVAKATLQPPMSVHLFICLSIHHNPKLKTKNQSLHLTTTNTIINNMTHNIIHIIIHNITQQTFMPPTLTPPLSKLPSPIPPSAFDFTTFKLFSLFFLEIKSSSEMGSEKLYNKNS